MGTRAEYRGEEGSKEIPAFVHHVSDFLNAAKQGGLTLGEMKEWWHSEDTGKPPRLVSFMFGKQRGERAVE